jgi:cytochrome c oxidase subunit III
MRDSVLMNGKTTYEAPGRAGVNPLQFLQWMLIISIVMMFAAFTSAYIVRSEEGDWLNVSLPNSMLISSALIVLSSICMQWALVSARRDNLEQNKLALLLTLALGLGFLVAQWNVWGDLIAQKVFFGGEGSNPAGSFLYVMTGVHGFHLVTGLIYILIVLISSFKFKVHSRNLLRIKLCTTYWHFLGGLWIYLHVFLLLNN